MAALSNKKEGFEICLVASDRPADGLEYTGDVPKLVMKADLFDADGKLLSEISLIETDMNGRTNLPEAFNYFREDFIATLSGVWRQENLYTLKDRADVHVEVPVSDLQSWYGLRSLLSELPIVQTLYVVKLTSISGLLKLSLSGSVEALQMAVRSVDIGLSCWSGLSVSLTRLNR